MSNSIILLLKAIFARLGIPEVLRSDNGPQYASYEFADFANFFYGFQHLTNSLHFPQSSGEAEHMGETIRGMLKNSKDPHLAVISYTPMAWCGLSLSELSMGRKPHTL